MANGEKVMDISKTKYEMAMSKVLKEQQDTLLTLPPRHARGCPKNLLRTARWQLHTAALTDDELNTIITVLEKVLPCKCPEAAENGIGCIKLSQGKSSLVKFSQVKSR